MKIIITIEDTENDKVTVNEERLPADGENVDSVTTASALADAMIEVMDSLGKQEEQ